MVEEYTIGPRDDNETEWLVMRGDLVVAVRYSRESAEIERDYRIGQRNLRMAKRTALARVGLDAAGEPTTGLSKNPRR